MRVTGVDLGYPMAPYISNVQAQRTEAPQQVVSKEWMMKLLSLVMYNQTGITYKLARIAAQYYAGLNLDVQA